MTDSALAVPAATTVLPRDTPEGLETLMSRRSSKLNFAAGMWVFPGGRVDPEDAETISHRWETLAQ